MSNNGILRGNFTKVWWIPLLTGLVSIGLGIWCFLSPAESISFLALLFAACFTAAGILNVCYSFANIRAHSGWGWSLALGLLEIIAGIWLFALPEALLVTTFMWIVGIWIIVSAINSICESTFFAGYSPWAMIWMILLLIATLVFAFIFLSNPIAGGVAVWLWIGLSLIFFGIYRITFAFGIRALTHRLNK